MWCIGDKFKHTWSTNKVIEVDSNVSYFAVGYKEM